MTTIKDRCVVCYRYPEAVNGWNSECSHVDCPHRRKAWSEGPDLVKRKGPWLKDEDGDPEPLDSGVLK